MDYSKPAISLYGLIKLIVMKLDRIARTATSGFETVKELLDHGVAVHVLNMGLVDNTPTGRLILQIMLNFAEFEREMIKERTAAGKAIARQKPGYKEGRPKQITPEIIKQIKRCVLGGTGDQQDDVV